MLLFEEKQPGRSDRTIEQDDRIIGCLLQRTTLQFVSGPGNPQKRSSAAARSK